MSESNHPDPKTAAQLELQARDRPVVGGVYRHYKGGLYVVTERSVMEDTLVPLVTYRSNARGTSWTRTMENFLGMVRLPDGSSVRRFARAED